MAGLRPPHVPDRPVPVFAAGDLARLERACVGRSFQQRRDAAMIAIFAATGIRLSELAGLRCDPGDPQRSDIDLWHWEITVHGKGRTTRTVKISYAAARALDRHLRARARHAEAYRPQLWLGVNNRGPMTASGIYQVIARRGRQCGVQVFPHRFRHHFSHTWQVSRVASDASFRRLRERALPAAQRAALRRPRSGFGSSGMRDLRCHRLAA